MDDQKIGTDHSMARFEQRLRVRGASAAGAVHVLRSLRSPATGPWVKQPSLSPERTSIMKTITRIIRTALYTTTAKAADVPRTALSNAPENPSGHAGSQERPAGYYQ